MAKQISKAEQEIIDQAVKRLKIAVDADSHNREAAIDDLKFANGEQWSPSEKKNRSDKGRPALTINLLPKFINQVVGDMLHNTPSIKLLPIDSRGDVNIAKIRQGIIGSVEYQSNSKGIYSYASKQQVTCGYGAWRVLTRYTEENPFLQEAYLEGIRNPFLVYLDPSAKDQNYADAKWGLLLEKMSKDTFDERYPKASVPSSGFKEGKGLSNEHWYDGELITVAEYFTKETETVEMLQLEDGRVVNKEDFDKLKDDWKQQYDKFLEKLEVPASPAPAGSPVPAGPPTPAGPGMPPMPGAGLAPTPAGPTSPGAPPGMPPMPPMPPMPVPSPLEPEPKIVKRRDTEITVIKHRVLTSMEILDGGKEGKKFPGKFVPLVLLKGKELNIEGKNYVTSLIRDAKDPQKLNNYWQTAAAETIALAPKAPWLATPKQIEGHEEAYASANVENFPVLLYNVDPEAPGPPQRQMVGQPPVAMFEQIRRAEENIKSVIGMFNADVGGPGSEQTGAAITARQRPGDIATFEFSENLARAVMFTGRILNEIIPEIYDSERDVRIRNFDESESFVPVNTTVGDALDNVSKDPDRFKGIDVDKLRTIFAKNGKDAKYNDITAGKYDVVVSTGPSYATQRQESASLLMSLTQAMPQQMAIAADLIVESMDFKAADELAQRLRKQLPANLVKPRAGETPPAPPQPPPQVLLAQAKVETEKLKGQALQAKIQLEQQKAKGGSAPEQTNPKDMIEAEMSKLKLQMEHMKMEHEKGKIAAENEANQLRNQLEQSRLSFEVERQKLSVQLQREAHNARLAEMSLNAEIKKEEARNKPQPKKRSE